MADYIVVFISGDPNMELFGFYAVPSTRRAHFRWTLTPFELRRGGCLGTPTIIFAARFLITLDRCSKQELQSPLPVGEVAQSTTA